MVRHDTTGEGGQTQREQAESEVEYAKECLQKEREGCKCGQYTSGLRGG